jgi:hypothetical protein
VTGQDKQAYLGSKMTKEGKKRGGEKGRKGGKGKKSQLNPGK